MNDINQAQSILGPAICQRTGDRLSDFYGGYIDAHTFGDIESALAGALEREGVLPDEASEVVRRNGLSPFDRTVAHRLAAEAIHLARGRSGMGFV